MPANILLESLIDWRVEIVFGLPGGGIDNCSPDRMTPGLDRDPTH